MKRDMVLHHDPEDFRTMNYPEPPTGVYPPVDMMSPDSYTYSRGSYEPYAPNLGFDQNGAPIYDHAYIQHNRSSPPLYNDDDMRGASTMSTASASSSNMGSPLSNPGQPSLMPDWATAPHGLGVSPGIVDQPDCYTNGTEYSFHPNVDGFSGAFAEFNSKPGFVGELSQIPRSRVSPRPRPGHAAQSSVSSVLSADSSSSTIVAASGLALQTRLPRASPTSSPSLVPTVSNSASSAPSLAFASPSVSSTSSFSSPPPRAWSSPTVEDVSSMSPTARPQPARLVSSPFFSQSGGLFVPPLNSSYPSLIHPDVRPMGLPYESAYPPPNAPYPASPALSASPQLRNGSTSPFINSNYQQYSPFPVPVDAQGRRPSLVSFHSGFSEPPYSGDESKEKQRCPHPDCGKTFKDLKAHMLTHQTERPEKCPIASCDYHVKGFARKYDKNRHTLTHYKGTMVCGFCPGSGSATEKSFNRADVFKRHLTAVHGVEQTPPNSRKKTAGGVNTGKKLTGYAPDATGKCSTCSQTFSNAQDFYEHLDDCVLRIVQQEDPAEAINAKRLAEVENDREVHTTLEKNNLPTTTMTTTGTTEADDEDDEMLEDDDFIADEDAKRVGGALKSPTKKSKGNPPNGVQKSRGMTHSRGGVSLPGKNRGRKNRRDYPSSWGFDKGQMTMKKRVMAVFDGPRRLAKDDMMLSTEHEVRVKLMDGKSYVTDLDVQTLKRAEGFHGATDEEKGPWISDDPTEEDMRAMLGEVVAQ